MQLGGKDKARGKRRSRSHGMLRLLFRLSRKHLYFGIPTAMFLPDREDYTTTLPKVEYALRLMADYDPLRLARIQRHVASILIFTLPGDLAQWVDSLRMCVIDRLMLVQHHPKRSPHCLSTRRRMLAWLG
jgi:hypothetical protein